MEALALIWSWFQAVGAAIASVVLPVFDLIDAQPVWVRILVAIVLILLLWKAFKK